MSIKQEVKLETEAGFIFYTSALFVALLLDKTILERYDIQGNSSPTRMSLLFYVTSSTIGLNLSITV